MTRIFVLLLLATAALASLSAVADELRPSYLDIRETGRDEYAALWKVPARGDLRLGLYVRLPDACKSESEPISGFDAGAYFERWKFVCPGGLKGRQILIEGLRSNVTDVLARIEYLDGSTQTVRLSPDSSDFVATGAQSLWEVSRTYAYLGVEHILTSLDHLLFVLALIFLIRDPWKLVKTITAFTIAHSVTLAGATLGYFSLPQKPVEASIALSIVFLARELAKTRGGEIRLSERRPWLVAFAFGLLHGFGFAGALKEVGLPQGDIPVALLTFNLGVEAGQLLFIFAVLLGRRALSAIFTIPLATARLGAGYIIGVVATYWLAMRVSDFWSVS